MKVARLTILVIGAVMLAGLAPAADELSVHVVDMDILIKSHPNTKLAEYHLMRQREEYEAEQKEMLGDLEKLRRSAEESARDADNKALSDEERGKRKEAAKGKRTAAADMERKIIDTTMKRQKQLGEERMRQQKEIVADIKRVVKGYAEKKGCKFIFDNAAVLYARDMDKNDVTSQVRKLLEEEKPAAKE